MPTDLPLVTAVMPTRGRHGWATDALRMFHEQTYPAKEIVIIDDMQEPSFPVPPPGAVYERAPRVTIGAKRNLAVSRAAGQVICHWDSDDVYTADRIESQVQQLLESGADLVGYHIMPFVEADGQMRRFMYHSMSKLGIGVSLMYWRDSWEAKPFDASKNEGEDCDFLMGRKFKSFDGSEGRIVARIHSGNTSNKRKYLHLKHQWRLIA